MTSAKYFDAISLVVTRGHSCVLLDTILSQNTARMKSELLFCYVPVPFVYFVVKIEMNSIYYDVLKVN